MLDSVYSVTVPPGTSRPSECLSSFVYQIAPSGATATSESAVPLNCPEQ